MDGEDSGVAGTPNSEVGLKEAVQAVHSTGEPTSEVSDW